MDRLLTTKELEESIRTDYPEFCIADEDDRMSDILHFTREAQDAKTINIDRGAMAEWLASICPHDPELVCDECAVCHDNDVALLREGKAPWEEKDAIHTARRTPRTISPD